MFLAGVRCCFFINRLAVEIGSEVWLFTVRLLPIDRGSLVRVVLSAAKPYVLADGLIMLFVGMSALAPPGEVVGFRMPVLFCQFV